MRKPDFFLVGAPKCGTSLMDTYLRRHPDLFLAAKEPHYFGSDLNFNNPPHTEETYLRLFEGAEGAQRVGESSVWYLYSKRAAAEIHAFQPEADILVMLRNPVSMLNSLHTHLVYTGDENIRSFEGALAAEADRRAGRRIPPWSIPTGGLLYREVVRYDEQIQRYFDLFGRDKVMVILADDFKKDPPGVYRQVLARLGVRTDFEGFDKALEADNWTKNVAKTIRSQRLQAWLKDPARQMVLRRVRPEPVPGWRLVLRGLRRANIIYADKPPMDPATKAALTEELRPGIERLAALIDRDLSGWLKG